MVFKMMYGLVFNNWSSRSLKKTVWDFLLRDFVKDVVFHKAYGVIIIKKKSNVITHSFSNLKPCVILF